MVVFLGVLEVVANEVLYGMRWSTLFLSDQMTELSGSFKKRGEKYSPSQESRSQTARPAPAATRYLSPTNKHLSTCRPASSTLSKTLVSTSHKEMTGPWTSTTIVPSGEKLAAWIGMDR